MSTGPFMSDQVHDDELRQAALVTLRKKRDFHAHVFIYVMVNLLLTAIWFLTTPGGFYWPIFPILGWGIGVFFNAWDAYSPVAPSEERIQREMRRLNRR
jgi:uncharacterized membrane protein